MKDNTFSDQVRVIVARQCEEQGVPLTIDDPVMLRKLALLLAPKG